MQVLKNKNIYILINIDICMQITFNTTDDVEELKKIFMILQETISKKCGNVNVISAPVGVQQVSINPAPQAVVAEGRTSGGCKVIPYQDMSGKLSEILSTINLRRSY